MRLHGYFRSSTSYRVRIALNIKGVPYRQVAVNLLKGEQRSEDYRRLNPQGLVPMLETDEGARLTQSLAICEYLEERYPQPPLLPKDAVGRARVRSIASLLACEVHPLNNLRVLKYLVRTLAVDDDAKVAWYRHWVNEGFAALEAMLAGNPATGEFCHGDSPGLADLCLVPQVFNGERFEVDMTPYPTIQRIAARCRQLPAFAEAEPGRQADAV